MTYVNFHNKNAASKNSFVFMKSQKYQRIWLFEALIPLGSFILKMCLKSFLPVFSHCNDGFLAISMTIIVHFFKFLIYLYNVFAFFMPFIVKIMSIFDKFITFFAFFIPFLFFPLFIKFHFRQMIESSYRKFK